MSGLYSKVSPDNFPDFCDQRIYGKFAFDGGDFETKYPNIVNNDLRWNNSLFGETNPNWKESIRRGASATTAMVAVKSTVRASKCRVSVKTDQSTGFPGNFSCTEWKGYPYYTLPSIDPPTADLISSVRNIALAKFISRANAVRSASQFGETLGEWKETVKAVTNPISALRSFIMRWSKSAKKRVRKAARDARRKRPRRDGKKDRRYEEAVAKAVSGAYLEFVFGWIPLVGSVNEACKALLDRWDHPDREIVSGKGSQDFNGSDDQSYLFTHNKMRVRQGIATYTNVTYRFRGCIKTGADLNGTIRWDQSLGLLPENFIPTAYELFPFSFVLDYFLQVGDLINALSFRRSNIIWGTAGYKVSTKRKYATPIIEVDPVLAPFYPSYRLLEAISEGGDAELSTTSVNRQDIREVSLLPDLFWHMPFNPKAFVNMSAILTSNFARAL